MPPCILALIIGQAKASPPPPGELVWLRYLHVYMLCYMQHRLSYIQRGSEHLSHDALYLTSLTCMLYGTCVGSMSGMCTIRPVICLV